MGVDRFLLNLRSKKEKAKEYLKDIEFLETDKLTDDVIKHSLSFEKFKYIAVTSFGFTIGLLVAGGVYWYAKSDQFRANLIDNGIATPVLSFFYENPNLIAKEYEIKLKDFEEKLTKEQILPPKKPSQPNEGNIRKEFFEKYKDEIKEYVENSDRFKSFLSDVFISYLVTKKSAITINGKTYTVKNIIAKVKNLEEKKRLELLKTPATEILKTLNYPINDTTKLAMVNALNKLSIYSYYKYKNSSVYAYYLTNWIKSKKYNDFLNEFVKQAKYGVPLTIQYGYKQITAKTPDIINMQRFKEFKKRYTKSYEEKLKEYKEKYKAYLTKRNENRKKLDLANAKKRLYTTIIDLAKKATNDPSNYNMYLKKIEKLQELESEEIGKNEMNKKIYSILNKKGV